ncbi:MAG: translation initiation factor IF-2 [Patescibacteria group bacterium]
MNVTELYRRFNMNKEEFFPLVQSLGFAIGERAIKVDDRVAQQVIKAIEDWNRSQKKKSIFAEEKTEVKEAPKEGAKTIAIPEKITVKQFADALKKPVTEVIAVLMRNGIFATINEDLDFDTASIIAEDFGYVPQKGEAFEKEKSKEQVEKLERILAGKDQGALRERAPVVVVMGHVDHGKTSLLDKIRSATVAEKEAGGITQHIGAYQITLQKRAITFIDTPGHEAFTAMRSRGANIADVAILVVAADDGIRPQTVEAIEIMEKAGLPFVVAVNKMDKESADIEKVKKGLSELNLIPEDWGGKTIIVPVSALKGTGIEDLLSMVLLVADMNKEKIMAAPTGDAVGTIVESHIDSNIGPVATVLVQSGTLKIGDLVVVGGVPGKIKAMKNWKGEQVKEAPPSMPVQILGLKAAPVVGDVLEVTQDKKILKSKTKQYESVAFLKPQQAAKEKGKPQLPIVLKADTLGSLEAIVGALKQIDQEKVSISVINKGLGAITENDIVQAEAARGVVMGFNVDLTPGGQELSYSTTAHIEKFKIIYELLDAVKARAIERLQPIKVFEKIGEGKVLKIFKTNPRSQIVGVHVEEGSIKSNAPIKILRGDKKVGEGYIGQLQSDKKNVGEVTSGSDCGIRFDGDPVIQEGDYLEVYEIKEKKQA